jgi:hypothetical protein
MQECMSVDDFLTVGVDDHSYTVESCSACVVVVA